MPFRLGLGFFEATPPDNERHSLKDVIEVVGKA
jgi:hypothetical protein